jgi:hypothetical protein
MRAIEAKSFSGYGGLRQIELPKPQPAKNRVSRWSWPNQSSQLSSGSIPSARRAKPCAI